MTWARYDHERDVIHVTHERAPHAVLVHGADGAEHAYIPNPTVETDETGFVTRVELDGRAYVPEPVRCRDCKHFESDYTDGAMFDATVCWAWDNGHDYPNFTTPDGFCHRGERKSS